MPKPELTDKEDKVGLNNSDSLTTWTVNWLDIKNPAVVGIHLAYSVLRLWVKKYFSCSVLKILHVAPTCILPPGYWKFWQTGFLDTQRWYKQPEGYYQLDNKNNHPENPLCWRKGLRGFLVRVGWAVSLQKGGTGEVLGKHAQESTDWEGTWLDADGNTEIYS